jgi:hypothetical protein
MQAVMSALEEAAAPAGIAQTAAPAAVSLAADPAVALKAGGAL